MIWLLTRPIVWPVKATTHSVAAGYKTGRFFGYRRITVFLLGVGVGLLLAPVPGRELRAKLQARLAPPEPIALPAGGPGPYPTAPEPSLIDLVE
jgi:hypothetical protein